MADAVVETLAPVQRRYAALVADPGQVDEALRAGRDRAVQASTPRLQAAMVAVGLAAG